MAYVATRRTAGFATVALALSLVAPSASRAEDGTTPAPATPDKSGYTLFDPTPDDELRKFAPDRPTKGFSVRTIDAGHVELESDIISTTYSKALGVATRSFQAIDPNLRIGVTNWADVEVQFNGLQDVRSSDTTSGATLVHATGAGDVVLRTKVNLFGNDDGPAGLAVIPFVKLPSSVPVISNGAVESGVIVPLALRLPQDYLITLMTEVDSLKDTDIGRRYANFVNLIGVSHPLPGSDRAIGMLELFSSSGADSASPQVYTLDAGMNYRLDQHTILDIGINIGLNKAAPRVQAYTGISARF
ncbi:MAG: transporter [Xanthobacteraceae bacterium]|nr:transporter [Xanthobacteraceae bacterium]